MSESNLWASREEAKQILGLTEEEFSAKVRAGEILTHRFGKWVTGGRDTIYFVGKTEQEKEL